MTGIISAVASIILTLSVFIEISPIKLNPIQWFGQMLNKQTNDKIDNMDKKLNEHIAKSHRSQILAFQNSLLYNKEEKHTEEEWNEVVGACGEYEQFCEDNKVKNNRCNQAIKYIERNYQKCLDNKSFKDMSKED